MALKAFATKHQMQDRSQGAIPTSHPFLDSALSAASRLIRNYCGWHIAPVITSTFRYRHDHLGNLWLPSLHIVSVDTLEADGYEIDLVTLPADFDPDTGWTNIYAYRAVVTFSHGFEEVPEDLVDLTLQIAARALGSPLGYIREQAGPLGVTHSSVAPNVAGGSVLLPHEMAQLATYKIGWAP